MTARFTSMAKKCPVCGGNLRTKDSRPSGAPDILVRRRLGCEACGAKFTTHEIIVSEGASVGAVMVTVAAHDRAVKAINEMLAPFAPEDVEFARRSLGQIGVQK